MQLKKRYFGLVGLVILAYILYSLDVGKIFGVLAKINPVIFLAGVSLELFGLVLKGLKYKAVLAAHGKSISLLDSTKYFLIGFFLSLVTPGRIGDLARSLYVNKKVGSLGKSLSTVIFDRAIDLGMLMVIGFAAALFFSLSLQMEVIPLHVLGLVVACFFLALFVFSRKGAMKIFLRPLFKAFVPEKLKGQAKTSFSEMYSSISEAMSNRRQLGTALLLGLAIWVLMVFVVYLYLLSLGIGVPVYFVFLLFPLLTLVEMLPISFSGLGTREAAAIFLLGFYGIGAAEAVAFSVLLFAVGYALTAAIGFVLFSREEVKIDTGALQ
jgi:hypothetical protein